MRREAPLVVLVLMLATLAGCMSPQQAPAAPAAERAAADSPLLQRLNAEPAPANATVKVNQAAASANATTNATSGEPWWVARVNATPEGGLVGITWTVPVGALVDWGYDKEFNVKDKVVALEVAPIVPEGKESALQAWGLLGFSVAKEGGLAPRSGHLEVAFENTVSTLGTATPKKVTAHATPVFLDLSDATEGAPFRFVVMAKSTEALEFGVAFRVLAHDPNYLNSKEKPTETMAAFLAARPGRPLALSGPAGAGFSMDGYSFSRYDGFPEGPTTQIESRIGNPTVDVAPASAASAAGAPWAGTVSVSGKHDHGYSLAVADFFDLGVGASHWSAKLDARGKTLSGSGAGASAWPTILAPSPVPSVYGQGVAYYAGDGDGKVALSASFETATRPGLFQEFTVTELQFGATLQELLGSPAAKVEALEPGTVPLPAARLAEDGHPVPLGFGEMLFHG
jgi:hypothetical protein